jgi:periplasmic protein TonB
MRGQLAFSICASLGIHTGGALLLPWPDAPPPAKAGSGEVLLEVFELSPMDENAAPVRSAPPEHPVPPAPPLPEPVPPATPPLVAEAASEDRLATPLSAESDIRVSAPPAARTDASPAKPAPGPAARGGKAAIIASARYRQRASLSYPLSAMRRGIGGLVVLFVDVDAQGSATRVSVRQSSGHPDLDRAAIRCASESTYEPARVNGTPQPCRVEAPFRFDAGAKRQ